MNTEFPAFQQNVASFVETYGLEAPVQALTLDLASEVGELAKEVLKGTRYGRWQFEPPQRWGNELGGVFFALIYLANGTGVDLKAALDGVLQKYRGRLNGGSDLGLGRR